MDDCVAVVDDREKSLSLSEETTTEEVKPPRSAADVDEVDEKLKQNGSSGTGGGGLVNQLMSNLPSVVLHHKEEEEEEEDDDEDEVEPIGSNDQKQEFSGESAGGGIIDKIISHFHEPAAPLQELVESRKEEAAGESIDGGEQSISTTAIQKKEIDGAAGDGGIIDKIMSHLHGFGETTTSPAAVAAADQEEFVHSHDEQAQLQEVVGSHHKEQQVTESNGGGLLNQIITNLPTVSIPDGTSPKAEVASLLIHIVQD